MKISTLQTAREILQDITPMRRDCGRLCHAACCQPDEDGKGGVFLFPGEEPLVRENALTIEDAIMQPAGLPIRMLTCAGHCLRSKRPLGCMIFPLTPIIGARGEIHVQFDRRALPVCPLLRDGLRGLQRSFVEGVTSSLQLIASDPEGLAFLQAWQALESEYEFTI